MKIIRSVSGIQKLTRTAVAEGRTIALVPTMGYLHEGHLSLIKRAKKEADIVITSIFVNPKQFAPTEDLEKYPRDEKGDITRIRSAGGDIVFIPSAEQIYPPDFQTYVDVDRLTRQLEGAIRPGHFRGVTTVVAKLFNVTRPDVVVFGQKDFQQAIVLRQMTRDLGYPIRFVIAPTVREKDGLAMSSRNSYLSEQARKEALCLSAALKEAKRIVSWGVKKTPAIEKKMRRVILAICPSATIDYIAFNDFETLEPVTHLKHGTICSLAVRVHGVRLIDNMKVA